MKGLVVALVIPPFVSAAQGHLPAALSPAVSSYRVSAVPGAQDDNHEVHRLLIGHMVAFSPDGKHLALVTGEGTIVLIERDRVARTLETTHGRLTVAAFSSDSSMVFAGDTEGGITQWKLEGESSKPFARLMAHKGRVTSLAVSADRKFVISVGEDRQLILWDLIGQTKVQSVSSHERRPSAVCFIEPGRMIVTSGYDGRVRFWSRDRLELIGEISAHEDGVRSLAVSPDGLLLATGGGDNLVRVWEVATRTEVCVPKEHKHIVWSVQFSPLGNHLAAGGNDGVVRVWETVGWTEVQSKKGRDAAVLGVAFSPDGRTLAAVGIGRGISVGPAPSRPKRDTPELGDSAWENAWRDLAIKEAREAFQRIPMLHSMGRESCERILQSLFPAKDEIRAHLLKLSDEDPSVRSKAFADLVLLGPPIVPEVEHRLKSVSDPDVASSLQLLIRDVADRMGNEGIASGNLRRLRSIWLLERIGGSQARRILQRIARESPSMRERMLARSALDRPGSEEW